jgi:hypothetical protein
MPDSGHPSITDWAFHRRVRAGRWDVPRENAIRFRYYLEAYRYVYEGGF